MQNCNVCVLAATCREMYCEVFVIVCGIVVSYKGYSRNFEQFERKGYQSRILPNSFDGSP
jgi:hypothetical protein